MVLIQGQGSVVSQHEVVIIEDPRRPHIDAARSPMGLLDGLSIQIHAPLTHLDLVSR